MSDKIPLLFADDDYMITDPMKRILQRHGFLVRTADTARRAIDIVMDGFNPEVAVIDILIPRGDIVPTLDNLSYGSSGGLELSKDVQQMVGGRCRIMILTGLDDYREASQQAGVWGYYLKPIGIRNIDELIKLLSRGSLKDREINQPTLDVGREIEESNWGKER